MSEMRTEMLYARINDGENWEAVSKEKADGMAVIFTAYHPTEFDIPRDENGMPTGEPVPQEYGLVILVNEILDEIADVPEFVINAAVHALRETGCLADDDD